MATRTYTTGQNSGVRRLDDLTLPWVDIPLNLLDNIGIPIDVILRDVMTDPNDENKVFVVGQRDRFNGVPGIYWSDDAGVSWNKAIGDIADPSKNCTMLWEVWVVDSNVIYVTGDGGFLWKSTDGGVTFNETTAPPLPMGQSSGSLEFISRALHFPDAQNGVVHLDIGSFQRILITADGGASWVETEIPAPGFSDGPGYGVHMSVDYQVINVLHANAIYRSTDGGSIFAVHQNFSANNGLHLTWTDDNNLWAYGSGGHRLRSTDAGSIWVELSPPVFPGPSHYAGHHYLSPNGFYSEDSDILTTADNSLTGALSETSPYGITAVWTNFDASVPPPCGCPPGTVFNPVTNECDGLIVATVICEPTVHDAVQGFQGSSYGISGANFYDDSTTRPLPIIEVSNSLQDNLAATLAIVGNVNNPLWNGRLNAVGVWAFANPLNEWIGFTHCVNVPVDGVYCIGMAADNYTRFRIDGTLWVEMATNATWTFNFWHVIPVTLTAGTHIIEMEGLNVTSIAAFGAEIYAADVPTLMTFTTPAQLAAVTIFTTSDRIGLNFDLGEFSGCHCPNGFALDPCTGELRCTMIGSVPFEPCNCYLATNCEDPQDQVVVEIDPILPPLDLNLIYMFDFDPDKCWTIEIDDTCDSLPPYDTVTDSFVDCQVCLGVCYEFVDCEGIEDTFISSDDHSAIVGLVVNISTCPDVCWIVNLIDCPPSFVSESIVILNNYPDCVTCLPPPPPPPPLVINNRTVKPGYDTPGCPPKYVEKVSCEYAEALYQKMAAIRYGIEFCCSIDLDKWAIKKELLDLKMIQDPEACKIVTNECCAPCNVRAVLFDSQTLMCPAPQNAGAMITIP